MKHDLEIDLLKSDWIADKCRYSEIYSQNLYAALCNNKFYYGTEEWSCSWRFAGGLVSDLRDCDEDYMHWYCSGMNERIGYVPESVVTDEIRLDLMKLGWTVKNYE
jgi:hypothetical protein